MPQITQADQSLKWTMGKIAQMSAIKKPKTKNITLNMYLFPNISNKAQLIRMIMPAKNMRIKGTTIKRIAQKAYQMTISQLSLLFIPFNFNSMIKYLILWEWISASVSDRGPDIVSNNIVVPFGGKSSKKIGIQQ